MTCAWQYSASKNDDTTRLCDKEGHPFCKEHQFIAEVLEETEAVTREICEQRETAATQWRAEISRLRLLLEEADQQTPSAFVKCVHELLPALHQAAVAAVVYNYVTSGRKEE